MLTISFTEPGCNLCQSQDIKVIVRAGKYSDGRPGDIVRCSHCGLIYRYLQYRKVSRKDHHSAIHSSYPADLTNQRKKLFKRYGEAVSLFRKYNRILDVGSGHGYFLGLCREQGWKVFGVELNPELAQFAKSKFDIDVFKGSFEQARYSKNYFDVVTLWNVLEHLENPYVALRKAYENLRPGGAIFLKFTNANLHILLRKVFYWLSIFWRGIKRFDDSCIGMYAFNRFTITQYLVKMGFQEILIDNARPKGLCRDLLDSKLKAIIALTILPLAIVAEVVTGDRNLFVTSLLVRAIKP